MTTEFQPITDADWPESLAASKGGFATGLNVYRTMAHHPDLLAARALHTELTGCAYPSQSDV